jgi:hypothetical protein
MNEIEVYCRRNTILYIYETYIIVSYFGNKIKKDIEQNKDILDTLCSLLNENKNIPNFINITDDIIFMTQNFELTLKKRLVLDNLEVKIVEI